MFVADNAIDRSIVMSDTHCEYNILGIHMLNVVNKAHSNRYIQQTNNNVASHCKHACIKY